MKVEKDLTKLYYTIGEVSDMFGVAKSLIRYWETEFPKIKPKKDKNGIRRFTAKDIRVIEKVFTLVKERGFTLEGARKELSTRVVKNTPSKSDIKSRLENTLQRLEEIKSHL